MEITTQQELDDLIATADNSNTIVLNKDLVITFNCEIPCNIKAYNIKAYNIDARDIEARDIETRNIRAWNIKAWDIEARNIDAHKVEACNDIDARNIKAGDIKAGNIEACNIRACNIDARDIKAEHIEYYAFCIAHQSLKCKSFSGIRENSFHKCLDQEIEIVKEEEKTILTAFELTQSQIDKIKHLIQCKN